MDSFEIIAIDHGNKNTKVLGKEGNNFSFPSGYVESNVEPISKENLLIYNSKYYSVGANRFATMFDKSIDERFFKLTLAAIAHNLETYSLQSANIVLAVGLPISSYGILKEKFKNYFIRGNNVTFIYDAKEYSVNIFNCMVFPQGYSSVLSQASSYKDADAVCIDIGGYTSDTFMINKGLKLDINSPKAYNNGVIKLFKDIQQELIKRDIQISEGQIEDVLRNNSPLFFSQDIVDVINSRAEQYTNNLLDEFKESYELKANAVLFIGGGAMLLRKYIENSSKVGYCEFLDEYSNCKGYEILAKKAMKNKGE